MRERERERWYLNDGVEGFVKREIFEAPRGWRARLSFRAQAVHFAMGWSKRRVSKDMGRTAGVSVDKRDFDVLQARVKQLENDLQLASTAISQLQAGKGYIPLAESGGNVQRVSGPLTESGGNVQYPVVEPATHVILAATGSSNVRAPAGRALARSLTQQSQVMTLDIW